MENFKTYTIENTTNNDLDCRFFGWDNYLLRANFGSDIGLNILPCDSSECYLELLQDSTNGLTINLIDISSSSDIIPDSIYVIEQNPASKILSEKIIPIEKSCQGNICLWMGSIRKNISINPSTHIKFKIIAKSKIILSIGFSKKNKI